MHWVFLFMIHSPSVEVVQIPVASAEACVKLASDFLSDKGSLESKGIKAYGPACIDQSNGVNLLKNVRWVWDEKAHKWEPIFPEEK